MNRHHDKDDQPAELESQFILRMPSEPAKALKEALASGATNFKDRFQIRIENDVRYGDVRVDHWLMPAKVVDLPTLIESLKTIDNKSFYKTADICQMVICKEEDDQPTDEETTQKIKKKDPNKVDKKFLWPHGVTPPAKNVRRRRFRITLKKKYVEAPEIEKEVKRLLRVDNDAASVKWEVITEDDEMKVNKGIVVKVEKEPHIDVNLESSSLDHQSLGIEHDIFGGAVSDSDEDETNINVDGNGWKMELMDENSRLSADDSRLSDSNSIPQNMMGTPDMHQKSLVTEFNCEMFSVESEQQLQQQMQQDSRSSLTQRIQEEQLSYHQFSLNTYIKPEPANMYMDTDLKLSKEQIYERMEQVQIQLAELRVRREQQEVEIVNIENHALRQRFQEILDNLLQDILEKEQEFQQYQDMLKFHKDL